MGSHHGAVLGGPQHTVPVVEVHDGLQCIAPPCRDVTLEARQQWDHHVHSVTLVFPTTHLRKISACKSSCLAFCLLGFCPQSRYINLKGAKYEMYFQVQIFSTCHRQFMLRFSLQTVWHCVSLHSPKSLCKWYKAALQALLLGTTTGRNPTSNKKCLLHSDLRKSEMPEKMGKAQGTSRTLAIQKGKWSYKVLDKEDLSLFDFHQCFSIAVRGKTACERKCKKLSGLATQGCSFVL